MIPLKKLKITLSVLDKTNGCELKAVLNCLVPYNGKTIWAIKEKNHTSHPP
jgi:hypothetical protein